MAKKKIVPVYPTERISQSAKACFHGEVGKPDGRMTRTDGMRMVRTLIPTDISVELVMLAHEYGVTIAQLMTRIISVAIHDEYVRVSEDKKNEK